MLFQEVVDPTRHIVLLIQFAGSTGPGGDLFLVSLTEIVDGLGGGLGVGDTY